MPRVLNKYRDDIPDDAVSIMRPSKWGNPFVIGRDGNRDQVCDKYEAWLPTQPHLMAALSELRGKDVVCCCEPHRCHGRTLVRLANQSESMAKKLLLIDASNIMHRAWHAYPDTLTTLDGEPINALFGFTKILMSVLDRLKPDYACVLLDSDPRKGWRRKLDPLYKHRRGEHDDVFVTQFDYMPLAIKALNLASDVREGYEADDLVAAYCHKFRKHDLEIMIVSGDKDFMQLFTQPNVSIYDDMKKLTMGPDDTLKKFFVPPHQVTMVQALAGDKIDDVPCIKGFGYKTAAKFIGSHVTFKSLFTALKKLKKDDEAIKAKSKKQFKAKHDAILKSRGRIRLNHKLVKLRRNAPTQHDLKDLLVREPDRARLIKFLKRFQFNSLLNGLDGVQVHRREGKPTPTRKSTPAGPSLWELAKKQKK